MILLNEYHLVVSYYHLLRIRYFVRIQWLIFDIPMIIKEFEMLALVSAAQVFPKVFTWLLELYDVQSTLLVGSAVFLHICICGALMRPAPAPVASTAAFSATSAPSARFETSSASVVVGSPNSQPDTTRDVPVAPTQPSTHSNGCTEMLSGGSGSTSPAPLLNSNPLDDLTLSPTTLTPRIGSSSNQIHIQPALQESSNSNFLVHSSSQPSAHKMDTTSTTLNASKKSNWVHSTLCEYWKLIRDLRFLAFAFSVNIAISSNVMSVFLTFLNLRYIVFLFKIRLFLTSIFVLVTISKLNLHLRTINRSIFILHAQIIFF